MTTHIPFNRPYITGNEFKYIEQALGSNHASGDGAFTKKCHEFLEKHTGARKALLTTSCTHALEMAAILLNIGPNDEVIIPSFTFVSTANAFALRGARIVFSDIRSDTLNLDERLLEEKITARTKAIVPVHYAGVACEMDTILALASEKDIAVIEDNAHGLFGSYRDEMLGTLGTFGAQSFHETKNFSCGEGGALLINDTRYSERAEIVREKGTNRSRFFRGQVDKYSWVDVGSSYLPSDILAAFLFAQLEQRQVIQKRRKAIWTTYYEGLQDWAKSVGARLPTVPSHCGSAYHLFHIVLASPEDRTALIAHLRDADINAVFHYLPLHSSQMGRSYGYAAEQCPVTERTGACLLRLPFFNALTDSEQARVIECVQSFGKSERKVAAR